MSNRQNSHVMRSQRGFTLSEILVTTAIFAIIMIAALAVYDQSNKVFKGSTEAADMQQSTRVGFDKLVSDVRMAGFDYSRGGDPTNAWEASQPDEQIEFAGPTSLAFRANFNYNTAGATGNGLEPAITPHNTLGQNIFPFVTTNNDEIVMYALRSADSTRNNKSLSFYVDDYAPRAAFPSAISPAPAAGSVSHPERVLLLDSTTCTGCGIDTTNANPPYTLYRITDSDVRAGNMGTPVAENIRSLNFTYYTDANGKTLLTNADGTAITTGKLAGGTTFAATGSGAIGGDGQYNPDSASTTIADRNQRALVQSIRVDLVGMNANPDIQGYSNPTETIAAIQKYRQYSLSSLIVPRNLGKTGFPEPVYSPPAAPTINGMCTGICGSPYIYWSAPVGGGPVESYQISWDTSPTGAFGPSQTAYADPSATSMVLPDVTGDPSLTWYYRIVAINSNGQSPYSTLYPTIPKNNTKPKMSVDLHVTDPGNPTPDAIANQIRLTWTSPATNDAALNVLACTGTGGSTDGSAIPSVETLKYRVYRSTKANFTLADSPTLVLDFAGTQPASGGPGSTVTWNDDPTTDTTPPAACIQYYYRVIAGNRCLSSDSYNVGTKADAKSDPFPAWAANGAKGQATGPGTPSKPAALIVDAAASNCPPGVGLTCTIKLQWNKVPSDTLGNAIAIDTYRITRYRKHLNNIPSSTYTLDTTFNGTGSKDIPGFAATTGSTATYTDSSGDTADTVVPYVGSSWAYEYTVAAKQCSTYGADSIPADYPSPCSINPTIVQAGGTGIGTGDTPADPWVLNGGDTITVTPPVGLTLSQVKFDVTIYPAGTFVRTYTASASPFVFAWTDLTDGQKYQVTSIVTTTTGCNETHIKYVQDETAASCNLNLISAAAPTNATAASTTTLSVIYTIGNVGVVPIKFHSLAIVGPPAFPVFDGQAIVNWGDPSSPSVYSDITFNTIQWNALSDNFTAATSPTTRTAPSGFYAAATTGLPAAGTFTMTLRYQYNKNDNGKVNLTTNPTQKLCVSYQIPTEPGVTKKCNIVGRAASTANPAACD